MAITTMAQLVSAAKQNRSIFKPSLTTTAATYCDLWTAAGLPAAGSAPGSTSGITTSSSTTGSLLLVNPGASNTLYLGAIEMNCAFAGTLIVYDRLVTSDSLSGTVATAQTVGTPALTRYTSGVDVELWLEIYTATGASAVNVTASYTNTVPTSGQTTTSIAFPVSPKAGRMIQLPLVGGDLGVTAVASVTLSATTGTTGSFGVTLLRRLAEIPIYNINQPTLQGPLTLDLPQIQSNACLSLMFLSTSTSSGPINGRITTVEG